MIRLEDYSIDTSRAKSNFNVVTQCAKKLGIQEFPEGRHDGKPSNIYWHSIVYSDMKVVVKSPESKINKFPGKLLWWDSKRVSSDLWNPVWISVRIPPPTRNTWTGIGLRADQESSDSRRFFREALPSHPGLFRSVILIPDSHPGPWIVVRGQPWLEWRFSDSEAKRSDPVNFP